MKDREPIRTTFVQDTKLTTGGILEMLAQVARSSITTFRERQEASKKYYDMLERASENKAIDVTANTE